MLERDVEPLAPLLVRRALHDYFEDLFPLAALAAALVEFQRDYWRNSGQVDGQPEPVGELRRRASLCDED